MIEPLGVTAERLFQFGLIEPLEDATHRRVGGGPPQGCAREGCVQKAEPSGRPPRRKAAPGKAAFRRPSRRSIKVWICRYERAPLTIARIENRITPACPYIFPSARRRSGMAARQVRRSVVISNLRVGLLAMDSDRLPLRKRKDVLHGAAATFLSDRALNSPAPLTGPIIHEIADELGDNDQASRGVSTSIQVQPTTKAWEDHGSALMHRVMPRTPEPVP